MEVHDDDLTRFAATGAPDLPTARVEGHQEHDGARIWYAAFGDGTPVFMLHGGLGHSGNWAYQVPALIGARYQPILIDSRGHGRSTRDDRPFSYEQMASDVLAVMDRLALASAPLIGWSDGACIALTLAMRAPERTAGVFYFGCNMDPSGVKEVDGEDPLLGRCFGRHVQDYARLSATPDDFDAFASAVGEMMETQPNVAAEELAQIRVPVTIAHSEGDEFIRREHAEYLARTIPGARFVFLPGVTHFAPLQRPGQFNAALIDFLLALPA